MFDVEFENDIIGQALRDEAYLKTAVRICDAHHFGTREHSWLWKVISETFMRYRERATGRIIAGRAKDDFPDETKRKPYLALAVKLMKARPTAPKAALEELNKFVRHVTLQLALEQSAKELEKGHLEEAEAAVAKSARSSTAERNYTHIKWIEEFDERQAARKYEREHPEEFTVIPTGIKQLDKALTGGVRKPEVGLVMGTTGRGKSVMLSNLAHAGVVRGFRCAYFALEMPAKQVAMRHDARWSALRYDQFKGYEFKPSELRELEAKLKRAKKRLSNKFHIMSMPVKAADIRTIRSALDDLRDEHDFRPDMILLDSADHLRHVDKSLDSYRLQQAEVYWSLKQLAEEEGYVVWTSVHAGREWATQIATAEATSESYDKARIADLIISLNDPNAKPDRRKKAVVSSDDDDDDEPEEVKGFASGPEGPRRMELFLAKYRDGLSKLKIELDADFSRMIMSEVGEKADEEAKEE